MPNEPTEIDALIVRLSDAPSSADATGLPPSAIIERYRQILGSAVETGIITLDLEGRVTGWSKGARQILGWSEEEMLGGPIARIFPAESGGEQTLLTELADALNKDTGGSEGWRLRKSGDLL